MTEACRPRLLIVENDPEARDLLRTNLEQAGYEVAAADGFGEPLKADARRLGRSFRPHVALVDLRLSGTPELDTLRKDDLGGLELLPDLAPARCILRSAYLTARVTHQALRDPHVFDLVGAEWDPQRLKDVVAAAARQTCACKRGLDIRWPLGWSPQRVMDIVLGHEAGLPPGLVEDLIASVFPTAMRVDLDTIAGARPAPGRFALLKAQPDSRGDPLVLKLAPAHQVAEEAARYARHVRGRLGGYAYEILEEDPAASWATFWDLGAIPYAFLGASAGQAIPLARFYREHKPKSVSQPIERFFQIVWSDLYRQATEVDEPLFAAYDRAWSLAQILAAPVSLASPDLLPGHLPEPAAWVLENRGFSRVAHPQQAVAHGSLDGDSLFVDADRAWPIHFGFTGPGPILQDFVALEVDVATRLAEVAGGWQFYNMVLALVAPAKKPLSIRPSRELAEQVEIDKALRVISRLRGLAQEVTRYVDPREYYWGLLFRALSVAYAPEATAGQRERALLLGAVLCARLEHWTEAWPPEAWPALEEEAFGPLSPPRAVRQLFDFQDLSPDDFERLIYWLARRLGEFDQVQHFGGAGDKVRDVVAYKHSGDRRETWYIQAKRYVRNRFDTFRGELDKLAEHVRADPAFAPDYLVFATSRDLSAGMKDRVSEYATGLGLPAPYFWGRLELDERLKAHEDALNEFFAEIAA